MKPETRRLAIDLAWIAALVTAVMALVARLFVLNGKTMIWEFDGIAQHYPALYLFNTWVRGVLESPGSGVPLWSWDMGLGADIVGTLTWPVLGDPFALVSLLFPMTHLEWAYVTMFALRVLVAGLACALYLKKMGARRLPVAAGTLLYLFGTFLFFQGRHPYFVNAMVFLPLLLLGIELAIREGKRWPLTVFALLAAVANYYFFYMLTILTVLYAVARYFELTPREERWRNLLPTAARLAGHYLLGIALAAPILVPSALAVLGTARGQSEYGIGLLYPAWVYKSQIASMASSHVGARSTFLGFGYLAWLAVPVLLTRRRKHSALKFMIVALMVFVAVPWFGSALNGFTFPSNRFAFSLGLFLALAAALLLSEEEPMKRRDLLVMAGTFAAYTLPILVLVRPVPIEIAAPMAVGALTIAVLALERFLRRRRSGATKIADKPERHRSPLAAGALLGLVVVNVVMTGTFLYDPRFSDYIEEFVEPGVDRLYESNIGSLAKDLPEGEFYRVHNAKPLVYNSSMVQGFPSTSFYFSTMNGNLSEFRAELDSRDGWSSFSYDGFDDRVMPMTLVGTRYYIVPRDGVSWRSVPYGYERVRRTKRANVYANRYALPLGFVFEKAIDRSDYERLGPVDRQAAMLQGAVVDDGAVPGVPRTKPSRVATELPFSAVTWEGATLDTKAKRIERTSELSRIVLAVPPVDDAELYVEIADFDNVVSFGKVSSAMEGGGSRDRGRYGIQPEVLETAYQGGLVRKRERWFTPESPYYWGNRSQLVNLGYQKGEVVTVTIEPERTGTLSFESLKVYAVPMSSYREAVRDLRSRSMRDIRVQPNIVRGTVSARSESLLFLSIPYSRGWTARVDGEPAETVRANTGFIGVPVGPGEHDVVLRYRTPGLREGLAVGGVALAGIAVGLGLVLVRRRRESSGA